MTRREALESELRVRLAGTVSGQDLQVRVVDDPYGGLRLLVSSPTFSTWSWQDRLQATFGGDPPEDVMWFDILAPDETDEETERRLLDGGAQLPMWANRLATRSTTGDLILPSDLDEAIDHPFVVTLFSLRGGVGRSTALINAAAMLASEGRRVLCIDMDLEAPGLAALFGVEDRLIPQAGVVRLLQQLDVGDDVDIAHHLVRVQESEELYLLPAGIPDANYARRLATLDPFSWYEEDRNPFRLLMEGVKELPIGFDVVLLDARTGISPLNAPLVFDVSDMVVVVFFPHPQSIMGTEALAKAVLQSTTWRPGKEFTPELRFIVAPVPPSRDGTEGYWEELAKGLVAPWLVDANRRRKSHNRPQLDVDDLISIVPYSEQTAQLTRISSDPSLWKPYRPLAGWITEHLVDTSVRLSVPPTLSKVEVLQSLSFSDGIAERIDPETFGRTFLSTSVVQEALDPNRPIVVGRKGSGKSAIFRRLFDEGATSGLAPRTDDPGPAWTPTSDVFESLEARMTERLGSTEYWATYWLFHIGLALAARSGGMVATSHPVGGGELRLDSLDGLGLVELFSEAIGQSDAPLRISRWFERLVRDQTIEPAALLVVFDGLDTGFGQSAEQRARRNRAVTGLVELVDHRSLAAVGVVLKLLLREDIWRTVLVANKSHFFGRSVTLSWDDQSAFIKVALKQLMADDRARQYLAAVLLPATRALIEAQVDVEHWDAEAVLAVWQAFAGVRMSGGNTAFTSNWVWKRLSDGKEERGPRTLLQLCRLAVERELSYSRAQPYQTSLLRPRALIEALPEVSRGALEALREEFPELDSTLEALRNAGKTPFPRTDLPNRELPEEEVAVEVGLVSRVVDTKGSEPDRFWVPELYRIDLGLTRRGQV